MRKALIAFRFSGENVSRIMPLLTTVRDSLKRNGVEAYCTLFDEDRFKDKSVKDKEIMAHAFYLIDNSDILFLVQSSEERSEGMLLEVGYSIAKGIIVVVATKSGVRNTYLPEMGTVAFEWSDPEDLSEKIDKLNL